MKYKISYIIGVVTSLLILTQCGTMIESLQRVPTAIGNINQLVVICDEELWNSPTGDTFKFRFESAYPLLPAPEPLFDIKILFSESIDYTTIAKRVEDLFISG